MGKLNAKTSLRVLAAVGLLGTAISCGDMLKKKDDEKNNPQPPDKKTTPIAQFKVTSVAEGLTAAVAAEKTADGTAAVLKVTDIVAGSQLIAVSGTCPIGSFTAEGEYTTGAIKADCEVVLKAGATASFPFTADKLPKDGQAQFAVVPFGAFNLKSAVAGDCPTVGAWQGNNYSVPVTAACTATFQAVAAPYHLTGSANTKVVPTTAQHKFSVTITPSLTDLVEGSGYGVKFDGLAKAAATANLTPSYKLAKVISTTCPQGSQLDYASQIFRVAPLSAGTTSCDVSFEVENPCGVSGIENPTTIRFTSSSATDNARIDRLITATTGGSILNAAGTDTATGTGTSSCANSGCHGKVRPTAGYYDYGSKWQIWYNGAGTATTFSVASLISNEGPWWNATDSNSSNQLFSSTSAQTGWEGKILFPRTGRTAPSTTGPTAGVAGTMDPSFIAYDPLNSRFYRKLTVSHYRADGASNSKQMPLGAGSAACGTFNPSICLTAPQQEMMCHWIWNGAN